MIKTANLYTIHKHLLKSHVYTITIDVFYREIDEKRLSIRSFRNREKEGDMFHSHDGSPFINRTFNNQLTTKEGYQSFDYATIANQLRTVR